MSAAVPVDKGNAQSLRDGRRHQAKVFFLRLQPGIAMPSVTSVLKPILFFVAIALAFDAANQSSPTFAQVFKSRKDIAKKECSDKGGTWADESFSGYSCSYPREHKITKCDSSDKCATKDMPAPKPASTAPAKSLAGTGDVSKSELKASCAKNNAWQFTVENSGAYSCMDTAAGIAINCKKEKDCTENHVPVRAR